MNRLLLLLLAFQFGFGSFELNAENHWDNYIPERQLQSKVRLYGDSVNVRKSPKLDAVVLGKLPIGKELVLLEKTDVILTQNQITDYWYQVSWDAELQGYVWGGLFSDYSFPLSENTILIKNPGSKKKGFEYKVLQGTKILSQGQWKGGAIGNENFQYIPYPGEQFNPSPKHLFGLQVLIFSEIEYGYTEELLFSFDGKNLNHLLSWHPGSCDPPSCSESWLIFPKESVKKEVGGKTVTFKGEPDSILIVQNSYDMDYPETSEISKTKFKWKDGKFKPVK